jgi:hypothetical protein
MKPNLARIKSSVCQIVNVLVLFCSLYLIIYLFEEHLGCYVYHICKMHLLEKQRNLYT